MAGLDCRVDAHVACRLTLPRVVSLGGDFRRHSWLQSRGGDDDNRLDGCAESGVRPGERTVWSSRRQFVHQILRTAQFLRSEFLFLVYFMYFIL